MTYKFKINLIWQEILNLINTDLWINNKLKQSRQQLSLNNLHCKYWFWILSGGIFHDLRKTGEGMNLKVKVTSFLSKIYDNVWVGWVGKLVTGHVRCWSQPTKGLKRQFFPNERQLNVHHYWECYKLITQYY